MFFKCKSSNLDLIISSFDDLKRSCENYSRNQNKSKHIFELKLNFKKLTTISFSFLLCLINKAFKHLQKWSEEDSNNAAIQDVSNRLSTLYSKLDVEINEEKISECYIP
jgi:hypothetical protein